MSYSYIVGQNGTIKIILSSYIAMLAANGIGNLLMKYIQLTEPVIQVFETNTEANGILFKIFIFIAITLILVLKGGFTVDMGRHYPLPLRVLLVTIFGFFSAGLMMSTILVFIGGGVVDGILINSLQEAVNIPAQTLFVRSLIDYYNFWFAAPAIAFVVLSLIGGRSEPFLEEPGL
ncbi:MAG: hypothetical protein AB7J40_02260 [Candidatus Altimarinota bacterium]